MISPPAFLMRLPLLQRLIPSVFKRYAKVFKHRYLIERRMGVLYLIDQLNSVDRNLLIKGAWEPRQVKRLLELIGAEVRASEPMLFLDIGSHGALYSMLVAQAQPGAHIIAFEPDPTNLVQLRANLFINGMLERIEVMDCAVGDAEGTIPFHQATDANRGTSRMTAISEAERRRTIDVRVARLDTLVSAKDSLLVMKIDIEGGEMLALAGMDGLFAQNRVLMQVESFGERAGEVKAYLEAKGFRLLETIDHDHFFLKS